MFRRALHHANVLVVAAGVAVLVGCSSTSKSGSGDTPDLCPSDFQSVTTCTPAPGASCVGNNPSIGCALDALPTGLPCSGAAQCSAIILPCPGEVQSYAGAGLVDGYICTCVSSRWSCEDCSPGQAVCAIVEAPLDAAMSGGDASASDGEAGAADSPGPGLPESDGAQPMPDAFIDAYVGPGNSSAGLCGFGSEETFLAVGEPSTPEPGTEMDSDFSGGALTLSCKVDPSGGGFNVQLDAVLSGSFGGSVSVSGLVTATGGVNIQGTFTSARIGSFTSSSCSITFTYNDSPVPVMPPIAAGRIWGHIDCPYAVDPSASFTDGGPATCDAHADFLFQNCE